MGVRTRDQCHLLRQPHHRSPNRMCTGDPVSVYIKKKKGVIGLKTETNHNKRYNDNLCLFRCLALHRGCDLYRLEPAVKTLYEAYDQDDVPMEEFAGVTLDDFYRVETTFQTNVCVYKLVKPDAEDGKLTAELVRQSLCHYPETMYLNLHKTHFSFIQDVRMYCHSYRCRKCGDLLWNKASMLRRHERTCTGGVRRIYLGGVYHSTPSVFESLWYYPYRATFDFECWFDTEQLPSLIFTEIAQHASISNFQLGHLLDTTTQCQRHNQSHGLTSFHNSFGGILTPYTCFLTSLCCMFPHFSFRFL